MTFCIKLAESSCWHEADQKPRLSFT